MDYDSEEAKKNLKINPKMASNLNANCKSLKLIDDHQKYEKKVLTLITP